MCRSLTRKHNGTMAILTNTHTNAMHAGRRMEKDAMDVRKMLAGTQPPDDVTLAAAFDAAWMARVAQCPRSANQVRQRMYRAVRVTWPSNVIPKPSKLPMHPAHLFEPHHRMHFTDHEVAQLCRSAHTVGPGRRAFLLFEILLTTGCRLAALADLTWGAVRDTDGNMRHTALVREKGCRAHVILLTRAAREALASEERPVWGLTARRCEQRMRVKFGCAPADATTVMKIGTRQLRNVFYRICERSGLTGPHCHPHACRHTVARTAWCVG